MLKKLILFPFSGNTREALLTVLAINAKKRTWDVLGFIDDDPTQHGRECMGVKVLGGRRILSKFPRSQVLAVPGNPANFLGRKRVIDGLRVERERFARIIDPRVVFSPDATIGRNVLIMAHTFISCGVTIGDHCVMLPNTVVSHDSVVGDYCCVGSSVAIAGFVTIGSLCYIGSGARIRERISIQQRSLIGLGANVIADIHEGVVAVGNPARVMRKVA